MHEGDHSILGDQHEHDPDGRTGDPHSHDHDHPHSHAAPEREGTFSRVIAGVIIAAATAAFILWRFL